MYCTRHIAQRCSRVLSRRSLHSVPTLTLSSPEQNGISSLFTPRGYQVAWTDYQAYVIENLNRVSAETDYEHLPLVRTIAQTARKPEQAALYNFAAQAFSNHFFFDSLLSGFRAAGASLSSSSSSSSSSSTTSSLTPFLSAIEASFADVDAFKHHFSATAQAMIGSGWVWLVLDGSNNLRILSTYNAGTPFDFARVQDVDPNTGLTPLKDAGEENEFALYQSMKRSYSLTPIACLSVWEHSYLTDFGVAGKAAYVDSWFESVDWEKVQARMQEAKTQAGPRGQY